MNNLLKKLDYKANKSLVIFNIPENITIFDNNNNENIKVYKNNKAIKTDFILIFVKTKLELENFVKENKTYLKDFNNELLWFAYPRSTSSMYNDNRDLSREKGWDSVINLGYKSGKKIYIDDNWAALKFEKDIL